MKRGRVGAPASALPSGVLRRGETLYTPNAVPGTAVYGEDLVSIEGIEYRRWDPLRSKLAALLLLGRCDVPLERNSRVLYLGAASGTTASHVSDICSDGLVYCVEVSQRSFRDLLRLCELRKNMIPLLADASRPDAYDRFVEETDFVYQDIAQRLQTNIFLRNMSHYGACNGVMMLKSRSVDVNREPREIFSEVRAKLSAEGVIIREVVELERFSKGHAAFVVEV